MAAGMLRRIEEGAGIFEMQLGLNSGVWIRMVAHVDEFDAFLVSSPSKWNVSSLNINSLSARTM